jgi:serine protease Do
MTVPLRLKSQTEISNPKTAHLTDEPPALRRYFRGMMKRPVFFAIAISFLALLPASLQAAPEPVKTVQDLKAIEGKVAQVAERVMESTVALVSEENGSSGSGIISSADGLILTAAHVVQGMNEVAVVFPNGKRVTGKVLGANLSKDIAMVQITEPGPWAFVELGKSRTLAAGDWLVAMGHSAGFDPNRTPPVRFGRVVSEGPGNYFTSDCTLIGGDSGGPIFDLSGKVVGINSSIGESKRNNNHAGIDGFREDWDRLMAGETWGELSMNPFANPETPVLGIGMAPEGRRRGGVVVERVTPRSPAAAAGVRVGDVLTEIDGNGVQDGRALQLVLAKRNPGDKIRLGLERDRTKLDIEVTLVKREDLYDRRSLSRLSVDPEIFGPGVDVPLLLPGERETIRQQYADLFSVAEAVAEPFQKSAVRVFRHEKQVAYGTVVGDGRQILTKWSEIARTPGVLQIMDSEEKAHLAKVTGVYEDEDLALLSIDGDALVPVKWDEATMPLGRFVVAARPDGKAAGIGVVSVLPRSLREADQAFLGVGADQTYSGAGVRVATVEKNTGAEKAGLRQGDIILKVDERELSGMMGLRDSIIGKKPGDRALLTILRNGSEATLDVLLGNRTNQPKIFNPRLRQMEQMGGNISKVRDAFPWVLQSDLQLQPQQCGGPVIDINGRVVGISIAQADRTRSFIVPASHLVTLLQSKGVDAEVARVGPPKVERREVAGVDEDGESGPVPRFVPPTQGQIERASRNVKDMAKLIERLHEEMDAIEP